MRCLFRFFADSVGVWPPGKCTTHTHVALFLHLNIECTFQTCTTPKYCPVARAQIIIEQKNARKKIFSFVLLRLSTNNGTIFYSKNIAFCSALCVCVCMCVCVQQRQRYSRKILCAFSVLSLAPLLSFSIICFVGLSFVARRERERARAAMQEPCTPAVFLYSIFGSSVNDLLLHLVSGVDFKVECLSTKGDEDAEHFFFFGFCVLCILPQRPPFNGHYSRLILSRLPDELSAFFFHLLSRYCV